VLIERLRRLRAEPIVLVTAPPGYGKTTLLAQWREADPRPFAWLTLDRRDDDPIVLLTYLAAALDRIAPLPQTVFAALDSRGGSIWASAIPRLGAALAQAPPCVVVLDDVHRLRSRDCLDALVVLSDHLPRGSKLVLAGQSAPPPIARLRAAGRVFELGQGDLMLTDQEAHAALTQVGAEVTAEQAATVNARGEGWAAALYLLGRAIRDGRIAPDDSSMLDGEQAISEYLRWELLASLQPRERRFLTRTAVLETLSAPLCDTMLEETGSARMLASLERANRFVVPLDPGRDWYRYHYLFRDLLRHELAEQEPELVGELNRRASAWCLDNGRPGLAVDYALASGDRELAASLVTGLIIPVYRSGRVTTVEGWLEQLARLEILQSRPDTCVLAAWIHLLQGRPREAEPFVEIAARDAMLPAELPDGSKTIQPWLFVLQAVMCREGPERMRDDAQAGIDLLPPASPWVSTAWLLLGFAFAFAGDSTAADEALARAAEEASATGAEDGAAALAERSLIALQTGDLERAEAFAGEAVRLIEAGAFEGYMTTALTQAVTARLATLRGDNATAREALLRAQRIDSRLTWGIPWFAVHVRLEAARVHLALKDPAAARTLLSEIDAVLDRRPQLGLLADQAEEFRRELAEIREPASRGPTSLTSAELRLLPLLTTHLTFAEIGERLFVTRNTVKTQAISIYRKLGASSRGEAVERAAEIGLLDAGRPGPGQVQE